MADYQLILEQLEEEQENIARLIVWVKGKMAQQDGGVQTVVETAAKQSGPSRFPRFLPRDAFFRMSVTDAIKKCLNAFKRPMTAKDITETLNEGGLTHQAKNLYATVYPTLLRMEAANEVARVGKGEWGLAEWYPGGKKTSAESSDKG
jgi:HB1, ASXL, restriction endonuclease HTH domain